MDNMLKSNTQSLELHGSAILSRAEWLYLAKREISKP